MNLASLSPKEVVSRWLPEINIETLARETGWQRRRGKKLSATLWMEALMACAWQSDARLGLWAWQVACQGGQRISVQGLSGRVNKQAVKMVRELWARLLAAEFESAEPAILPKLGEFSRVLVQDSTCLNLPEALASRYPGSGNASGKCLSQARLDVVYELRSAGVLRLGLAGFRRNDQRASSDVLALVRRGDLLIRDLGYAVMGVWSQLIKSGVAVLTRCPQPHKIYLQKEGKRLHLLKTLRGRQVLDIRVEVGHEHAVPMRLVALAVPPEVAATRRRKARQNRDRRLHHSEAYYELLGWTILLTTLDESNWSPRELAAIYGLRWRIETFFKAVKQSLPSTNWHPRASALAVELALHVRLVGLLWVSRYYAQLQRLYPSEDLSILQVFKSLSLEWRRLWTPCLNAEKLTQLVLYYCRYHKRTLPNYNQAYSALC